MADVTGVQHEGGRDWQRIDFVHRRLQGAHHVRVRRLVEPHVAVADLDETEFAFIFMAPHKGETAQAVGAEYAAFDHAKGARPRPRHTLQETSAVNSVMVVVVQNFVADFGFQTCLAILFIHLRAPWVQLGCPSALLTAKRRVYSQQTRMNWNWRVWERQVC